MQEFEHLKLYEVLSNLEDRGLKNKLATLAEFILQSNQTHKTKWYKSVQANANRISEKKMKLFKNKSIAKAEKLKTLEDLLETESYFTMETLGKTKVEFEFFLNLIVSMSLGTVPKMMRRILKGNYDRTGIKFKDYLKDGKIKKIIQELYDEKHLDYHKMEKNDKEYILEVYKLEKKYIFDFLDFIEEYLEFLEKARNNMYHNFTFVTPRNREGIMYPEKYIKGSLPLFVFNQDLRKGYIERYMAGRGVIKDYTLMMNVCVLLEKIPLNQYARGIERDQRVIQVLVSPDGKKRISKYNEILEKYGFPMKDYEHKSMKEELRRSREGKNIRTQQKMREDFRKFLEKYPPKTIKNGKNI